MARARALAGWIMGSRVPVELAGGEHVPDNDDDRMFKATRAFMISPCGKSSVLGSEMLFCSICTWLVPRCRGLLRHMGEQLVH